MTRQSVHIVIDETADGKDGFAQWIDGNKIHKKRLNLAPNILRGFFKRFKYVIVSPAVQNVLGIGNSTYAAKDFVEILIANQRRS